MSKLTALLQPDGAPRLGEFLEAQLGDVRWTELSAAIAFVKVSGVRHVAAALERFARRAQSVRIAVGIDQMGSSLEGVQLLWQAVVGSGGEVFVVRNPMGSPSPTFHPKTWFFRGPAARLVITGSGNLTGGGLYANYESGIAVETAVGDNDAFVDTVSAALDAWTDASRDDVVRIDAGVLQRLHDDGDLPSEDALRRALRSSRTARAGVTGIPLVPSKQPLFAGRRTPGPPTRAVWSPPNAPPVVPNTPSSPPSAPPPPSAQTQPTRTPVTSPPVSSGSPPARTPVTTAIASPQAAPHVALYMTVAPRNKTEIYLTKGALQDDPGFFGAPFTGLTTPKKADVPAQPQPDPPPTVSIVVYGAGNSTLHAVRDHTLKMWFYKFGPSANDDFRITLPAQFLRDTPDDSVFVMTKDPPQLPGHDYLLELYPPANVHYRAMLAKCTRPIRNSTRRYGWA